MDGLSDSGNECWEICKNKLKIRASGRKSKWSLGIIAHNQSKCENNCTVIEIHVSKS